MVIVIRNATGIDLCLAVSADGRSMRFRVLPSQPPPAKTGEIVIRLPKNGGHGIPGCPEGLNVRFVLSGAGAAIRVATHREKIDALDDDGELAGEELYAEYTLRLLN